MKRVFLVIGMLVSAVGFAGAELRVWSDAKGNETKAEYIKLFGDKVILKKADGKQIKVPVAGLCDADKTYLAGVIPPKIKIAVDVDKDRELVDSYASDPVYTSDASTNAQAVAGGFTRDTKRERVVCNVEIEKVNAQPSTRTFVAHVYVFGKALKRDMRQVMSYTTNVVAFAEGEKNSFATKSGSAKYSKLSNGSDSGFKYEGYIVVLEDEAGEVFQMESSVNAYESNVLAIRNLKKGDLVNRRFVKEEE